MHVTKETRLAALFIALSGLLHLPIAVFDGLAKGAILLAIAALYLILSFALRRTGRWLRYIVFAMMLIGAVGAYITMGGYATPAVIFWAIIVCDLIVAAALFVDLWHGPEAA